VAQTISCLRSAGHQENVALELVSLKWKQKVRDACSVQRRLGVKKMLAFVLRDLPRVAAYHQSPRPARSAQTFDSLGANRQFGSQDAHVRANLMLQHSPQMAIADFV